MKTNIRTTPIRNVEGEYQSLAGVYDSWWTCIRVDRALQMSM